MAEPRLDPRKTPRQTRSRRTVERILDAAARIFDEQGYRATTTNDIADEAGVSIGSLYQYFPNKDAVLAALARRHIETATAGLTEVVARLDPGLGLAATIQPVIEFLVEQHDLDRLHQLVAHAAPRTHEIDAELERAKGQLVALADALLTERIPHSGERHLAAQMTVAVIDAAVHDVIIRQPRGARRRAAVALTVTTVEAMIEAAAASHAT